MRNKACSTIERRNCTRFLRWNSFMAFVCFAAALPVRCGQAGQPSGKTCVPEAPAAVLASGPLAPLSQQAFSTSPKIDTKDYSAAAANGAANRQLAAEFARLRKSLENAARHGDSQAQVNLAVASLAGWGAPPNAGAALYWFHTAADRGYPLAFYDLGILYMNGCGIRQDYKEAFQFFEKGARGGDSAAQVNLGYLYDQGLGITRDRAAAAFWYGKAAEAGVATAQYNLADLYLRGEGVRQDDVAAVYWFEQAAVQGHPRARVMLGSMYAAGRGRSKDLAAAYMWLIASEMESDPQRQNLLRTIETKLTPAEVGEAKLRAKSLGHSRSLSDQTTLLR
jgi:TPR repeat protein